MNSGGGAIRRSRKELAPPPRDVAICRRPLLASCCERGRRCLEQEEKEEEEKKRRRGWISVSQIKGREERKEFEPGLRIQIDSSGKGEGEEKGGQGKRDKISSLVLSLF